MEKFWTSSMITKRKYENIVLTEKTLDDNGTGMETSP
jgi:hypothetical protein